MPQVTPDPAVTKAHPITTHHAGQGGQHPDQCAQPTGNLSDVMEKRCRQDRSVGAPEPVVDTPGHR